MDEYIKREDALDAVLFALVGTGHQSKAIYAIRDVPTADVVPKSEVEMLQGALKAEERHNELTMEMEKKALANAKAEVAMDVFAEIERAIGEKYELYVFDDREIEGVKQDAIIEFADCMQKHFDKLKKKYTEKLK